MAVDQRGFIAIPEFHGFQTAFETVVNDVVQNLIEANGTLIHSIYVYGSVAKARAQEAVSDLDLTIILNHEPSQIELDTMNSIQCKLEENHPVISKVDFDIGYLHEVMIPENLHRWGYWLKHHCVCIYGHDLRNSIKPFKPSRSIALAVNGDFMSVLDGYINQLTTTSDQAGVKRILRAASRKVIRATSILRQESDKDWPETLEEHAKKFSDRYPALEQEMDYFLAMSDTPRGDIMVFSRRLQTFSYWLNAESQSRSRSGL